MKYVLKPVKKLVFGDKIFETSMHGGVNGRDPWIKSTTEFTYMQALGEVVIVNPDFKNYIGGSYTIFNSFQYKANDQIYTMNVLNGNPVIVGKDG